MATSTEPQASSEELQSYTAFALKAFGPAMNQWHEVNLAPSIQKIIDRLGDLESAIGDVNRNFHLW